MNRFEKHFGIFLDKNMKKYSFYPVLFQMSIIALHQHCNQILWISLFRKHFFFSWFEMSERKERRLCTPWCSWMRTMNLEFCECQRAVSLSSDYYKWLDKLPYHARKMLISSMCSSSNIGLLIDFVSWQLTFWSVFFFSASLHCAIHIY